MKRILVFLLITIFFCTPYITFGNSLRVNPDEVLKSWTLLKQQCMRMQYTPDKTRVVHLHKGLFENPTGIEPKTALLYWDVDNQEVFSISWMEGDIVWHFLKYNGVWKQIQPDS